MKVNMNTALQIKGIGATIVDAKMPTKTAYKFMKLLKAIEEEETFFNDKMREIIFEYGKKDENGQPIFLENGNVEIVEGREVECNEKVRELENIEVEIPDTKFSIDELEVLELSPRDIYALEPVIE